MEPVQQAWREARRQPCRAQHQTVISHHVQEMVQHRPTSMSHHLSTALPISRKHDFRYATLLAHSYMSRLRSVTFCISCTNPYPCLCSHCISLYRPTTVRVSLRKCTTSAHASSLFSSIHHGRSNMFGGKRRIGAEYIHLVLSFANTTHFRPERRAPPTTKTRSQNPPCTMASLSRKLHRPVYIPPLSSSSQPS